MEPPQQRIVARQGENHQIVADYQIRNRGRSRLILGEPTTSCGCTAVSLEPRIVEAGGAARLLVKGEAPGAGERAILIHVPTNTPERVLTGRLSLVGSRPAPFLLDTPDTIQFGVIHARDDPQPELVRLESREREETPPGLGEVVSESPDLRVEGGLVREVPVGEHILARSYEYKIEPLDRTGPGIHSREIILGNKFGSRSFQATFRVTWTIHESVYAIPERLYGCFDPDSTPTLRFVLATDDPDVRLQAEPDPGSSKDWQVEQSVVDGRHLVFQLTPHGPIPESRESRLVLRTNHPDTPTVTVPVLLEAISQLAKNNDK
jgi:hypothetical protein